MMTIDNDPNTRDSELEERSGDAGEAPRPFDTSKLSNIPQPQDDDPPYRDWWVMQDQAASREPSTS